MSYLVQKVNLFPMISKFSSKRMGYFQISTLNMSIHRPQASQLGDRGNPLTLKRVEEGGEISIHLDHGNPVTRATISGIHILLILPHHRGGEDRDLHRHRIIASWGIITTLEAGSPIALLRMKRRRREDGKTKQGEGGRKMPGGESKMP